MARVRRSESSIAKLVLNWFQTIMAKGMEGLVRRMRSIFLLVNHPWEGLDWSQPVFLAIIYNFLKKQPFYFYIERQRFILWTKKWSWRYVAWSCCTHPFHSPLEVSRKDRAVMAMLSIIFNNLWSCLMRAPCTGLLGTGPTQSISENPTCNGLWLTLQA